jgi:uncharacterized protein (UPF0332 family)
MQAFDPRQYVELARRLAKENNNQAALRSAISRAYYGAFLAARPLAAKLGVVFDHSHKEFWEDLGQRFEMVGAYGTNLRIWRNHADYDPDIPITPWNANYWIKRAERIIELLEGGGGTRPESVAKVAPAPRLGAKQRFEELSTARPMPGLPSQPPSKK